MQNLSICIKIVHTLPYPPTLRQPESMDGQSPLLD
jgi:hypothetical protein